MKKHSEVINTHTVRTDRYLAVVTWPASFTPAGCDHPVSGGRVEFSLRDGSPIGRNDVQELADFISHGLEAMQSRYDSQLRMASYDPPQTYVNDRLATGEQIRQLNTPLTSIKAFSEKAQARFQELGLKLVGELVQRSGNSLKSPTFGRASVKEVSRVLAAEFKLTLGTRLQAWKTVETTNEIR